MPSLPYLDGYPEHLLTQVRQLIAQNKLGEWLLQRYPTAHDIRSDKALFDYVNSLKQRYLRKSGSLNRVVYDNKIQVIKHALGLHTAISRIHGGKLKAKAEIRIATLFKTAPEPFLKMIVVHELAHFKEKEHDAAFYSLCRYMEPDYHQLEFDCRVYLTYLALYSKELPPLYSI